MTEPTERPATAASPLSVILFARALATDAAEALEDWRRQLDQLNRPYEIILIQETRADLPTQELREATRRLRVLPYERAQGFQLALNEAIASAQYPLLAFSTCDKQYLPGGILEMLKLIDRVDLVAGYRAGFPPPPWRVLLDTFLGLASRLLLGMPLRQRVSWLGHEGRGRRWIARWVFGLRVLDPECPFRLARREVFARLPIQSGGPFVLVEMLAKANHLGCFMDEAAVSWTPPAEPLSDSIGFGEDAWQVFRAPDFGPIGGLRFALAPGNPQLVPERET